MAMRYNAGKLKWRLLPWDAIREVVKVLTIGSIKYDVDCWRTPPYLSEPDIDDSLVRHRYARIVDGELYDKESGLLHSAHLTCNALFLLYYDLHNLFGTQPENARWNTRRESRFNAICNRLRKKYKSGTGSVTSKGDNNG